MRYFLGDLGNTANVLVLCSVAVAIIMQGMCEWFRAVSGDIVATKTGHRALSMAARYYWWAIGFQRASLGLLCMALVTQQVRLQAVKEIAVRQGLATATSVITTEDFSTGETSGNVANQIAFVDAQPTAEVPAKNVKFTTAAGNTVEIIDGAGGRIGIADRSLLRDPERNRFDAGNDRFIDSDSVGTVREFTGVSGLARRAVVER